MVPEACNERRIGDVGLHHQRLFIFICQVLHFTIEFQLQQQRRERGDLKRTNT